MKWCSRMGALNWRSGVAGLVLSQCATWAVAQPNWVDTCGLEVSSGSPCIQPFSNGLSAVLTGSARDTSGLWGFIDGTGRMVIAPAFAKVRPFSNGMAAASVDGLWGYIDMRGQWAITPRFNDVSPFNTRGTALVKSEGSTLLINSRGDILKTFPTEVSPHPDFEQVFQAGFPLAEMRQRSPTLLWNTLRGEGSEAPADVIEIAHPQDGLFPARQIERESGSWGFIDRRGKWAAQPSSLQSDRMPWHQRGLFAVLRPATSGPSEWHFVNAAGKPAADLRCRSVQVLRPGVWLVQFLDGRVALLNAQLQIIRELGHDFAASPIELFANWAVLPDRGELLLVGSEGQIKSFPSIDRPRLKRQAGVLWVERADARRPGGYDLALIINPQGQNLLDEETRQRLWIYKVHPIASDDGPPDAAHPLPLARVMPLDPRQFKAILTPGGKLVVHRQWESFKAESGKAGPWITRSSSGHFGAISAMGRWVVPPRFESIRGFANGYSWARPKGGETGSEVLINARGKVMPLPKDAGINMNTAKLSEGLLIYPATPSSPGGIWDIASGRPPKTESFDRVEKFQHGLARASKGGRWGVVNREAKWVIEPRYAGASTNTLTQLDATMFSVSRLGPGDSDTEEAHRMVSAGTGREVTGDLSQPPKKVGPGRYLTRPLTGGVEVFNERGKLLLTDSRSPQDLSLQDGWIRLSFAPQFGIIDSTGQWRLPPRFLGSDRTSSQTVFEPAGSDGLTVFSEKSKFGLMDARSQRVVPPQFDALTPMYGGRSVAQQKNRFGNGLGYIDRSGNFVIVPQFEVATNFQDGHALVKRQGLTQFIDATGQTTASFRQLCGQVVIFNNKGEKAWPPQPLSCLRNRASPDVHESMAPPRMMK